MLQVFERLMLMLCYYSNIRILNESFELFGLTEAGYILSTGKMSRFEEGNKNYDLIIYIYLQVHRMLK